jgi:hypothetical protein
MILTEERVEIGFFVASRYRPLDARIDTPTAVIDTSGMVFIYGS